MNASLDGFQSTNSRLKEPRLADSCNPPAHPPPLPQSRQFLHLLKHFSSTISNVYSMRDCALYIIIASGKGVMEYVILLQGGGGDVVYCGYF